MNIINWVIEHFATRYTEKNWILSNKMSFFHARHAQCHGIYDTITMSRITVSNNDTVHGVWAGYRQATAWFFTNRCFLPPLRGSNVNIVFTVGFATPKVLASSTAKFLSPLRGFVAPLSGAVSTVTFRGLRTLRVLAHGYEKSRPAGGCRFAFF